MSDSEQPDGSEPRETGGRAHAEQLWDDDAFRARVIELARARSQPVREAIIKAGTSSKYMDPSPGGRNTNVVMRLAKYLGVHPAYLMFGPVIATGPDLGGKVDLGDLPIGTMAGATFEQRLAIIAQLVADYWLHVALDPRSASVNSEIKLRQIAAILR